MMSEARRDVQTTLPAACSLMIVLIRSTLVWIDRRNFKEVGDS